METIMTSLGLSNIELRSNLLSVNYQREMSRITAFEIKNIWDRNPNLTDHASLTLSQQQELKERLFWGSTKVSLEDNDRSRAWVESLAERVEPALDSLEGHPTLEDAFELLVVTGQMCRAEINSIYREKAIEWHRRVRAVLARDEFHFTSEMIDQRLCQFSDLPIEAVSAMPPSSFVSDDHQKASPELTEEMSIPFQYLDEPSSDSDLHESISPPIVSPHSVTSGMSADPDLERILRSWPRLPEPFKASILALLDGVEQVARK